jgi:Lrp/AsnC family transcriptional regulator of lysine biosynthesis
MKKDKDKEILKLLAKNSRMSNVDIAKRVGITEGAVRSRIRKLVKTGVIRRFTIEVSEGLGRYAVLMAKSKADTKRMMSDISSLGLHKDAYEISGEYDGCIILHGASVEEIDGKIDRIRKLKSVADTRTSISFRRW